jgi:hypothetical protein
MNSQINQNEFNMNVIVKPSKIPQAGNGLFAGKTFEKGETICTYGGQLVDVAEAKYLDPMYIVSFENGKGFKLCGDNAGGDLGLFANAVHPDNPQIEQNAKFSLNYGQRQYLPEKRGRFPVLATRKIEFGEEIIVNYGHGYWTTMYKWENEKPVKSRGAQDRDERALKRARRND